MDKIWANRLIEGTKEWNEVPPARKDNIRELLREKVEDNTITAERYKEITGEE